MTVEAGTAVAATRETCACPLCGASQPVHAGYAMDGYEAVRCGACGAWYLSPRLTEAAMMAAYARDDYFEGGEAGYAGYAAQEKSLRGTFRRLLGEMQRRGMTGGGLLDVGCGYGYLLDEARGFFAERAGTDFSPAAAGQARAYGAEVWLGGADAVPAGRRFHCVTALHVVEHVYHPHQFVAELAELVEPGGWLVLAAPDAGSFWRKLMGRRWPSWKFPEHVMFYERATLERLVRGLPRTAQVTTLPYPHAFPVSEVAAKLRLKAPGPIAARNLWLPATTVCVAARLS
ncbi:MAG TPA: class I SAM-dependent methyltransferase [Longimicrobium sp.]|nr:class I SAM-dependent methyltransferase [Longimicrobium sp.]